jgi:putative Holliday junction resolvase
MRILALDWGTVRVGGAISDPDGQFAFALEEALEAKTSIEEIKKLIAEKEVGKIIIGLPKSLGGQDTASTTGAEKFIEKVRQLGVEVETVDERFSSVAAGKALGSQGIKEKDQRGMKDNMAAQLMLQQYLDTKNN